MEYSIRADSGDSRGKIPVVAENLIRAASDDLCMRNIPSALIVVVGDTAGESGVSERWGAHSEFARNGHLDVRTREDPHAIA